MGSGESDARLFIGDKYKDRPMMDGPNVHHYKTYTRGTTFHVFQTVDVDGNRHTFHVPEELYSVIEQSVIYGVDKR